MHQNKTAVYKAGLLLICCAILGTTIFLAAPSIPKIVDFDQTFYPAIRYLLAGENPYTADYIVVDGHAPSEFFSPAWLLPILLPFGLLPQPFARAAWGVFLTAVLAITVLQMQAWGFKRMRALLLLMLPWALIGLVYGQVTPLVLLGAIWALNILHAPQTPPTTPPSWLGAPPAEIGQLLLAFLLIGLKPQLGVFIALPLVLEMLWRRDRRLVGLAVVGGLIVGLTLLFTLPTLLGKAANVYAIAPAEKSTLEQELRVWGWPLWWAQPVRLLVVATMARWLWLQKRTSPAWWAAWLTAVLILTPYTRPYDGALLLPLLGQLFLWRRWRFGLFILLALGFVALGLGELGNVPIVLLAWILFVPWAALPQGPLPPNFAASWHIPSKT